MRVYLDAAPIIYVVQRVMPFATAVDARLAAADSLVASELGRMECIILPIRTSNVLLLNDFHSFLTFRLPNWFRSHEKYFSERPEFELNMASRRRTLSILPRR